MILSSTHPSVPCHSCTNCHWIDRHFKGLLSAHHSPYQNCPWSVTKCVYLKETTQPSSSPPQNDRNVGTNCLSSWSTLLPRPGLDVCAVAFRVDCTTQAGQTGGPEVQHRSGVSPCLRAEFLEEVNFWEPGWVVGVGLEEGDGSVHRLWDVWKEGRKIQNRWGRKTVFVWCRK